MLGRRNLKSAIMALTAVGGGSAIALLPVLIPKLLGAPPLKGVVAIAAVTAAALIGEAWALGFVSLMHRSFDEFQQERAKSAWYWGGGVGLVATMPIWAFIASGGVKLVEPTWPVTRPLLMAFTLGFVLPCAGLGIGYFVASLWSRRARP